ncbi:ubiquitin-like protein, partial [Anaeromyces robustus]
MNNNKSRNENNNSASSYYSTTTSSSSTSSLSSYSKSLNQTQLEIHRRFKKMKNERAKLNNQNNNNSNNNDNNNNNNNENDNNVNNENINKTESEINQFKVKDNKKSGVVNITVNTLTGQQFPIKTLNTYTISDLKDLIQEKEGVPSQTQILIFQDKTLDCDSMTLEDYGIKDGSSLKLMIKLFDGLCNIEQTDTKRDNTIVLLLCKKKGYLYLFETSVNSSSQLFNESFDSSFFDFCNSIDDKSVASSEMSSKPSSPNSTTYSNSSFFNKESLNFINSQTSKS